MATSRALPSAHQVPFSRNTYAGLWERHRHSVLGLLCLYLCQPCRKSVLVYLFFFFVRIATISCAACLDVARQGLPPECPEAHDTDFAPATAKDDCVVATSVPFARNVWRINTHDSPPGLVFWKRHDHNV